MLLQTPLKGVDGKIYALAQGAIIVGGYSVTGAAARTQKNTTTVASIPGGAIVEREVPFSFNSQEELTLNMQIADFSTTQQVVERLNKSMGGDYASAPDISTVRIKVPSAYQGNLVPLLATVENLEVTPESRKKQVPSSSGGMSVLPEWPWHTAIFR